MGAALACATETADSFAATREAFENVLRVAGSEETQRMHHSDLERLLADQGQQLLRQLYQDSVERQAQAEVTDEVVDAHGTQRTPQPARLTHCEVVAKEPHPAQLTADVTVADMSGAYLAGTYLNLIPSGLNMSGACVTGVYHTTSMSLSGKGAGNECQRVRAWDSATLTAVGVGPEMIRPRRGCWRLACPRRRRARRHRPWACGTWHRGAARIANLFKAEVGCAT